MDGMADSVVDKGNPALVIVLFTSFIVLSILGGAVYVWFYHVETKKKRKERKK